MVPGWSDSSTLSKRTPTLKVQRLLSRQASFRNASRSAARCPARLRKRVPEDVVARTPACSQSRDHHRVQVLAADDRVVRQEPEAAAGLVVVVPPRVLEGIEAAHDVVRAGAVRGEEVGALQDHVLVVPVLLVQLAGCDVCLRQPAHRAERGRVPRALSRERSWIMVPRSMSVKREPEPMKESVRREYCAHEEVRGEDARVVRRQQRGGLRCRRSCRGPSRPRTHCWFPGACGRCRRPSLCFWLMA